MKERGKFVVLEGGVGCGKSTQEKLLREGLPYWEFYREPGGTPFGEKIRDAVQGLHGYDVDRIASLFAYSSSRANLIRGVVIPRLEDGANVLLDRFWYSTFAYQGTEGVSKLLIWGVSLVATRGLKPNMVLHYELSPEVGKTRKEGRHDADRYDLKGVDFHQKVRKNYLLLSKLYPGIWKTIDASQPIEKVFEDSMNALKAQGIV